MGVWGNPFALETVYKRISLFPNPPASLVEIVKEFGRFATASTRNRISFQFSLVHNSSSTKIMRPLAYSRPALPRDDISPRRESRFRRLMERNLAGKGGVNG